MALYKYMKKQHLRDFIRRGSLKIGTLHEYRQVESYGSAIGDEEEGVQFTEFNMPDGGIVDLSGNTRGAAYLRQSLPGSAGTDPFRGEIEFAPGVQLLAKAESPNFFIYCTSARYDRAAMEEFGYDACLEIFNVPKFFNALSRAIRHKGAFIGNNAIEYRERKADWTEPRAVPPWLLKSPEYAYQTEIRAVWHPQKNVVKPLFIDVPRAVKYCRPFELSSS
jgi:hypothetical protein